MNLENINVVNMKKIIIIFIVSLYFTQAYAFKTCKELGVSNEQGLGLTFAILSGLSYLKGYSDAKELDIEFGSELNDSFSDFIKSECKKNKNSFLFQITINYINNLSVSDNDKLLFVLNLLTNNDENINNCILKNSNKQLKVDLISYYNSNRWNSKKDPKFSENSNVTEIGKCWN